MFGESLGEEIPEELSDEDCATTIMTRPAPKESKPAPNHRKKTCASPNGNR